MISTSIPRLVPVRHRNIQFKLMYSLMGLPGAIDRALLAGATCQRLYLAADYLEDSFGPSYKLQVWDAYRSLVTQQAIFDTFRGVVQARSRHLTDAEIDVETRAFVNPATGAPPHACGGAVDLTLLIDDREAEMGTAFDAFVPEAAGDYYERHEPRSSTERAAKLNRRILQEVMQHAGFVAIPSEFWHWEFGTCRWAEVTGEKPILTSPLRPPGDLEQLVAPPLRPSLGA